MTDFTDEQRDKCGWHDYDGEYWFETDCGSAFVMNIDQDNFNWLKYCCFCGKPAEVHKFQETGDFRADG